MNYVLKDREPQAPLHYFEEISQIPRGSGNEKAIATYIENWAKERNLYVDRDSCNNLFIKKPGTEGYENSEPVLLQGHTDMVCEKNSDTVHDFEKDPIKLVVDGDYLKADGTTLGADDGVAVSYIMALLDSKDIPHPPLECLLTTSEEVGMTGAFGFDANKVSARKLINLDSDNENEILCGAAGGLRVAISRGFDKVKAEGTALKLTVKGLMGGHSGGEIHMEKGNSNKIMGRILFECEKVSKLNLVSIEGGSKENAIPREAFATIYVPDDKVALVKTAAESLAKNIADELEDTDKDFTFKIEEAPKAETMMDEKASSDIIAMLKLLPHGVRAKSMALKDLVVTSMNVGVVVTLDNAVEIRTSLRSSVESLILNLADEVELIARDHNAQAERGSKYPGWKFASVSPLRELCTRVYREMNGEEPKVIAIHAGLECGLFKEQIPDLDIISNGPNCKDIHTPDETLDLNSYARVWKFLLRLLSEMK